MEIKHEHQQIIFHTTNVRVCDATRQRVGEDRSFDLFAAILIEVERGGCGSLGPVRELYRGVVGALVGEEQRSAHVHLDGQTSCQASKRLMLNKLRSTGKYESYMYNRMIDTSKAIIMHIIILGLLWSWPIGELSTTKCFHNFDTRRNERAM